MNLARSLSRSALMLTMVFIGAATALSTHAHAQSSDDQVFVVVDRTDQTTCILNGMPCPAGLVTRVTVEQISRAQAQAAGLPSIGASASPQAVNAFSEPLALQIIQRRAAAHRQAQIQAQVVPNTYCPGQYITNNLVVGEAHGNINWKWTYHLQPFSNYPCAESGVELDISPNSGNTGGDSVNYAALWQGNPFDTSWTSDNSNHNCNNISSNPVFNQFTGNLVNPQNGTPQTQVYIHSGGGCTSNIAAYEAIYWQ